MMIVKNEKHEMSKKVSFLITNYKGLIVGQSDNLINHRDEEEDDG